MFRDEFTGLAQKVFSCELASCNRIVVSNRQDPFPLPPIKANKQTNLPHVRNKKFRHNLEQFHFLSPTNRNRTNWFVWGYTWKIHPILYNSSALRMSSFYVVVFWERAATKCIEIYYAHAKLLLNCSLNSVSSGCHFHSVLNLKAQNSLNETPIYEKFVICNLFVNILTYHYFFLFSFNSLSQRRTRLHRLLCQSHSW